MIAPEQASERRGKGSVRHSHLRTRPGAPTDRNSERQAGGRIGVRAAAYESFITFNLEEEAVLKCGRRDESSQLEAYY